MATFIALKQLENANALISASLVGTDFSQSVINVVSASIVGVLPNNLVSSSIQIANFGFATTQSLNTLTQSVSVLSGSVVSLQQFSSSLDITFATDYEVYVTSSQIIDQGEF
jgi:hypothetical protein